jgi:hypothetical protein
MANDPLELCFEFPMGIGDLVTDFEHPITAAFRRGIEEGQLTGTWYYLVIHDTSDNKYTIIGTFTKTPNNRVLFFPGADIAIDTGDPTSRFNGTRLDHITSDPPRNQKYSSHVAVYGLSDNKSRGLNHRSKPPKDHMWPWFSLLIPNLNDFPHLPRRLIIQFTKPSGDLIEFGQRVISNGGLSIVALPSENNPSHRFIQFDVWIGRQENWQMLKVRPIAWAYKPEVVESAPNGKQDIQVNRVDIPLAPDIGLAVLITRPIGNLSGARILRPTLSY